jgi:hypothetical protein
MEEEEEERGGESNPLEVDISSASGAGRIHAPYTRCGIASSPAGSSYTAWGASRIILAANNSWANARKARFLASFLVSARR